jgi:peroxiredoxin
MKICRAFLCFLLVFFSLNLSPLYAAGGPASSPAPFANCESFGIQRFPEKKAAPTFYLKTIDGKVLGLSDFKGKAILVTFWLSYCEACKEDIPAVEKLAASKKDQFTFITIVSDGEKERRIRGVVEKYKLTAPVLLDLKEKISHAYGVTMAPTSFVIDPEGFMVGKIVGQRDWASAAAWSALSELLTPR